MSMHVQGSNIGLQRKELLLKAAACVFLFSMFLAILRNPIVDPDLWHQMALIRESIHLGYIPLRDQFAYTPTIFPSVHHEWGAGVIAYLLAIHFGGGGILALKYLLAFSIAFFSLYCMKRKLVSVEVLIFLVPIGILLIRGGFSPTRAQMYSFAFVTCLLWFFELDRGGNRRWLIAWIPLYIVWVNLHAGFLIGIGLLAIFWLEGLLRRTAHMHLIAIGLVMVGLVSVNPYGINYYQYLFHAIMMPRPDIKEWYPIWKEFDPLQVALVLMSLILLIYSVKKIGVRNAHGLCVLIAIGIASFFCRRLIFFYGIVWTVYTSSYLQKSPLGDIMHRLCRRFSIFLILLLCIAAVVNFVHTASFRPWKLLVPSDHVDKYGQHPIYPVGLVEYLAETSFKGNLMVFFDWGSYVIWKSYPSVRVSIDSRYEAAYPEWLVEENTQFYMAKRDWQRTLTTYPTDLVLIYKKLPLAKVMPQQNGWKKVYTDNLFELYARPGLTLPIVDWTGRSFTGIFP